MIFVMLLLSCLCFAGFFVVMLIFDPKHRALKTDKRNLQLEVDNLKRQIVEKDKELQARRLGLPWYNE